MNWREKLVNRLLDGYSYLLVDFKSDGGTCLLQADKKEEKNLSAMLTALMKHEDERIKRIILDAAAEYLKPLEIESKYFIQRINEY